MILVAKFSPKLQGNGAVKPRTIWRWRYIFKAERQATEVRL